MPKKPNPYNSAIMQAISDMQMPVDPRLAAPVPNNGPAQDYAPWFSFPPAGIHVGPYLEDDPGQRAAAERSWAQIQDEYAGRQEKARANPTPPPMDDPRFVKPHEGFLDPWGYEVNPGKGPTPVVVPDYVKKYGVDPVVEAGKVLANPVTGVTDALSLLPNPSGHEGQSYYPPGASTMGTPLPVAASLTPDEGQAPVGPGGTPPASYNVPPAVAADVPPPPPPDASPDAFASYEQTLDFVKKLYGDRPTTNARQDKADQNAESEKERTRLLAQLAFASGLTASGGKSWEGLAQGFAGAANTYGQGFKRYQDALQDSADRFSKDADRQYAADVNAKSDALSIYMSTQDKIIARSEKNRDDLRNDIMKMVGMEIAGIDKSDFPDPVARAEALARGEESKRRGYYIPPPRADDVATK